jgi:hypothetical protein
VYGDGLDKEAAMRLRLRLNSEARWMIAGTVLLLAVIVVVMRLHKDRDVADRLALKVRRLGWVSQMGVSLTSAAEAERSAVMAVTDEDSQRYAGQARQALSATELASRELEGLLSPAEHHGLAQFTQSFAEFRRIEEEVIDLAVKNTNLKASNLAFGEAASAVREMDAALAHLRTDDVKIVRLADDARISAWRILALLPPHIVEESSEKMDALEAEMTREDREVRSGLDALAGQPQLAGSADLKTAVASYDRFGELRTQILKLSRENTNVRSLSVSLNQGRRVMLICQSQLAALQQAIAEEPIAGVTLKKPVSPRGL